MSGTNDAEFLREALELATRSAETDGGPFGAVVVRDGAVLGRGTNRVTAGADPTAHAEVVAIREACRALGTHELRGCVLYTSCEPCPMCLASAWWARIERIVFAAAREDAARAGFDDALLYEEIARPLTERALPIAQALAEEAEAPFAAWRRNAGRVSY